MPTDRVRLDSAHLVAETPAMQISSLGNCPSTLLPDPMVIDGDIVARPMMYLAVTYDHRIIDGKEAVQFLVSIKDQLEDPARLLLQV